MNAASSIWVKICGNTSLEDARLAAEADANAVGFVFAPSPRRVTSPQVAAITPHLPPELEKIGIFVDSTFDEIASIVDASGLTGVQVHCHGAPDLPALLRARFGPNLRILSVVHFGAGATDKARAIAADPNIDAILVDSRTATAVGGTGLTFDWESAGRTLFKETAAQKPMVAAGGLSPLNVAEAIAALHPWGVDVVSGVEAAPGRKDPLKVRDFVAVARARSLDSNRV
jgi:phosphoribosylanthranilate isomerase